MGNPTRGFGCGWERMLQAARGFWRSNSDDLRNLLVMSNEGLAPLRDPLLLDFGLHRWLRSEREETYSDWLEWVIKQMPGPRHVLKLFGIDNSGGVDEAASLSLSTEREKWVKLSHWASYKKLDLVLRYPGRVLIVVEVKVTDAENAYTAKQSEYAEWASHQHEPKEHRHLVLLAKAGQKPDYEKFRLLSWSDLCAQIRRMIPGLMRGSGMEVVQAAFVLAFVGAVEQNVLGLHGVSECFVNGMYDLFNTEQLSQHLRKSLE